MIYDKRILKETKRRYLRLSIKEFLIYGSAVPIVLLMLRPPITQAILFSLSFILIFLLATTIDYFINKSILYNFYFEIDKIDKEFEVKE